VGRLLVASAEPQVKDGRLRALAILKQEAVARAAGRTHHGGGRLSGGRRRLLGRSAGAARMPKEIIAAFHREIARIVAPPDTTERTRLLPA
jgi:hypothetical protein